MVDCIDLLGKPTIERKDFAKERPVLIGTSLYYVVKMGGEKLNPRMDSYIQVSFDKRGALIQLLRYNL